MSAPPTCPFHICCSRRQTHRGGSRASPKRNFSTWPYLRLKQTKGTHHVERLEDLALITRTVTIQGESCGLLLQVLLGECKPGTNGHLRAHDTVTTEEARREDVHRATFAVRHTSLATEELSDDALDRASAKDGERMAAVGSDDEIVPGNRRLESDRYRFLFNAQENYSVNTHRWHRIDDYLSSCQMAEATNEFLPVEGICGHLHASHGAHLRVHVNEHVLRDLDLQARNVCSIRTERVFM